MKKLNIGCGRSPFPSAEGWVNLDIAQLPGVDCVFNLEEIAKGAFLPFPVHTFSHLEMSHVLEHLHNPLPIMEELHRVAAPDATFHIRVPYGSSDIAFEDPTHIRQYFLESFSYFGQPAYARADYGYRGDWAETKRTLVFSPLVKYFPQPESPEELLDLVRLYRNLVEELIVELQAIHPIRSPEARPSPVPIEFAFRGAK
jgi:SAM-dependent methyltransferase